MEMMRLTKYPLLFESIAKYSADPSDEVDKMRRATDKSRAILAVVNKAKQQSECHRRLVHSHISSY